MNDRLWLVIMQCTTKKTISRLFGWMARQSWSRHFIPLYIKMYNIDTNELDKDVSEYAHLTDFFVRRLCPGARQVDTAPDSVVSPVDGTVSQLGTIDGSKLLQAKGYDYTVEELLGGDRAQADAFLDGCFVTIYLSPKDYHRIHAPVSGTVTEMVYLPGSLFPVNERGVRLIDRLFVKNERIITYIQSSFGPIAVVKVGATNVGSINVWYDDRVRTNAYAGNAPGDPGGAPAAKRVYAPGVFVRKGEEIGWFEFGSTVILLFPPKSVSFLQDIQPGSPARMGETIGTVLPGEEAL